MRYGIAGASGTLGRVVVQRLLGADPDAEVVGLVRRPDAALAETDRCTLITGGVFDREAVREFVAGTDVVVNLAARNPVDPARDAAGAADFFAINALGAALLATACSTAARPLLHFSSVAVYEAGAAGGPEPAREDDPLPRLNAAADRFYADLIESTSEIAQHPRRASDLERFREAYDTAAFPDDAPFYALSKLMGESLTVALAPGASAIRMSDVYGPGHESRGVVTDHLAALAAQREVVVDFDFRATACFVYIDDVVRLTLNLAERLATGTALPQVVNFCGAPLDEAGFADELRQLALRLGLQREFRVAPAAGAKADRRYATALFEQLLPDFSATSFGDGLLATWQSGAYRAAD
ncbi:MAG: NAD(P)-dependent oxidoreductase [Pseudomonadota bacterium]